MSRPVALTPSEVKAAVALLPAWEVIEETAEGADPSRIVPSSLHRLYAFPSFLDAMHFMLTAARFIQNTDHHPRWQNVYSKVEVWITTGELDGRLSAKDVKLAQYLEQLFQQYGS